MIQIPSSTYVAIVVAATLSTVSSLALLLCFKMFPNWANRPSGTKHILLVLTVYDFVAGANYFINPRRWPELCQVQSTLMQVFEIGAWVWTCVLSVELARALFVSIKKFRLDHSSGLCVYNKHTLAYHVFVHTYCAATVAVMQGMGVSGLAGDWCWTTSSSFAFFTYITLWISFGVIAFCSIFVLDLISNAESGLRLRESMGAVKRSEALRRRRNWRATRRLLLIPFAYMLLHVPGTLRRCAQITNCPWCDVPLTRFLQALCDPSQGTVNFLLFGLMDRQLQGEIKSRFAQTTCSRTAFGRALSRCCSWMISAKRRSKDDPEDEFQLTEEEHTGDDYNPTPSRDPTFDMVLPARSTTTGGSIVRSTEFVDLWASDNPTTSPASDNPTMSPCSDDTQQPSLVDVDHLPTPTEARGGRTVSVVMEADRETNFSKSMGSQLGADQEW